MKRIGIHPDWEQHGDELPQSYSARWKALAEARGFSVVDVDMFNLSPAEIEGLQAIMWRPGGTAKELRLAKIMIPVLEATKHISLYPNSKTLLCAGDKVFQKYLLEMAGIPAPRTEVFWKRSEAISFCQSSNYPFVCKLATGWQSENVALIRSKEEAEFLIDLMFHGGLTCLAEAQWVADTPKVLRRLRAAARVLRKGQRVNYPAYTLSGEANYFIWQEFLQGNEYDTRVMVSGNYAWAFRRFNRPGDFRASGSGLIDMRPENVDLRFVKLAFKVARRLDMQLVAIDGLYRGDEPVVAELALSFASWAQHAVPGHWWLRGDPDSGTIEWSDDKLRVEDTVFLNLMERTERGAS